MTKYHQLVVGRPLLVSIDFWIRIFFRSHLLNKNCWCPFSDRRGTEGSLRLWFDRYWEVSGQLAGLINCFCCQCKFFKTCQNPPDSWFVERKILHCCSLIERIPPLDFRSYIITSKRLKESKIEEARFFRKWQINVLPENVCLLLCSIFRKVSILGKLKGLWGLLPVSRVKIEWQRKTWRPWRKTNQQKKWYFCNWGLKLNCWKFRARGGIFDTRNSTGMSLMLLCDLRCCICTRRSWK